MANWLSSSKLQEWEDICIMGFQYDDIPDTDIYLALEDTDTLLKIDPYLDWEDDAYLASHLGIPDDKKHAYRVASIINDIKLNKMQESISLDTYNLCNCCSSIGNGHHRIRALQYMNIDAAPFSLSGVVDSLERLVLTAGTDCKLEHRHLFVPYLLEFDGQNDILVFDHNHPISELSI